MVAQDLPWRHSIVVPVGVLDRRALGALIYANNLPATRRMAVHVAEDDSEGHRFGVQWMASSFSHVPLQILEAESGIARRVAEAVQDEADAVAGDVIVVIGRMVLAHSWLRFLHNRTSDAIVRALIGMPNVTCILVGIPVGQDEGSGLDVLIRHSIAPTIMATRRRRHAPFLVGWPRT